MDKRKERQMMTILELTQELRKHPMCKILTWQGEKISIIYPKGNFLTLGVSFKGDSKKKTLESILNYLDIVLRNHPIENKG